MNTTPFVCLGGRRRSLYHPSLLLHLSRLLLINSRLILNSSNILIPQCSYHVWHVLRVFLPLYISHFYHDISSVITTIDVVFPWLQPNLLHHYILNPPIFISFCIHRYISISVTICVIISTTIDPASNLSATKSSLWASINLGVYTIILMFPRLYFCFPTNLNLIFPLLYSYNFHQYVSVLSVFNSGVPARICLLF